VTTLPSAAVDAGTWAAAHDRLVESLRDLIRIPSINPPDPPGGELEAARFLASRLEDADIPAVVHEPVPGRGSVTARLRGDGTGGGPLLLLSHLDVVPAPSERWTHDPFAAEIEDGWLYGRGAVDMKDLVAMELEVMRLLAGEARAAGRDPGSDPIPGLRRDVLFASTADEEAGGFAGAAWLAMDQPETLRAAAAINEAGGVAVYAGARRLYPIQVAEKGTTVYRLTFRGTWGHGSMPRADNAALLAAEAITRLAVPLPARLTPVTRGFLDGAIAATDGPARRLLAVIAEGGAGASAKTLDQVCLPIYGRALDAMLRDTISPNVVHAGVKFNVIPGEAVLEIDVRRLPGSGEPEMEATIRRRDPWVEDRPRCPRGRTRRADRPGRGGRRDRDRRRQPQPGSRGPGGRAGTPARGVASTRAALCGRRHGQIRGARLVGERGRGHDRPPDGRGGAHRVVGGGRARALADHRRLMGELPPDPDAYDSPRAVQARARGLSAPYIAGGEDPNPDATRASERPYLRLLIAMVIVIVLGGFVLGASAKLLGFPS